MIWHTEAYNVQQHHRDTLKGIRMSKKKKNGRESRKTDFKISAFQFLGLDLTLVWLNHPHRVLSESVDRQVGPPCWGGVEADSVEDKLCCEIDVTIEKSVSLSATELLTAAAREIRTQQDQSLRYTSETKPWSFIG